jgi:hypothetical protein
MEVVLFTIYFIFLRKLFTIYIKNKIKLLNKKTYFDFIKKNYIYFLIEIKKINQQTKQNYLLRGNFFETNPSFNMNKKKP